MAKTSIAGWIKSKGEEKVYEAYIENKDINENFFEQFYGSLKCNGWQEIYIMKWQYFLGNFADYYKKGCNQCNYSQLHKQYEVGIIRICCHNHLGGEVSSV